MTGMERDGENVRRLVENRAYAAAVLNDFAGYALHSTVRIVGVRDPAAFDDDWIGAGVPEISDADFERLLRPEQ